MGLLWYFVIVAGIAIGSVLIAVGGLIYTVRNNNKTLVDLNAWMLLIDRKLTTVCTAVEIRNETVDDKFHAVYKHIGEQKEACYDKFKVAHTESDRRLSKIEGKIFNGGC